MNIGRESKGQRHFSGPSSGEMPRRGTPNPTRVKQFNSVSGQQSVGGTPDSLRSAAPCAGTSREGARVRPADLEQRLKGLRHGDSLCRVYENRAEQMAVPFITNGLA